MSEPDHEPEQVEGVAGDAAPAPAPESPRAEFDRLLAQLRRGRGDPAVAARISDLNRILHDPGPNRIAHRPGAR